MRYIIQTLTLLYSFSAFSFNNPLPWTPKLQKKIEGIVEFLLTQNNVPGAALAIGINGKVVFTKNIGVSDVDTNSPVLSGTLFEIGSTSKVFTATAIMNLYQKNLIDIDEKVSTYAPELPFADQITVRHLLSHRAGLPEPMVMAEFINRTHQPVTLKDMFAVMLKNKLNFEPGSQFSYSNVGFTYLALIVEKIMGTTFEDYVVKELLRPYGLKLSKPWYEEVNPPRATRYNSFSMGPVMRVQQALHHSWVKGAGQLAMTAQELLLWQLAFHNGEIVGKKTYDLMMERQPLSDGNISKMGLGFFVVNDKYLGKRLVGHDGATDGHITASWSIPEDGISIVLIQNLKQYSGVQDTIHRIFSTMYGLPAYVPEFHEQEDKLGINKTSKLALLAALDGRLIEEFSSVRKNLSDENIAYLATLSSHFGKLQKIELDKLFVYGTWANVFYRATFDKGEFAYNLWYEDQELTFIEFTPWYALTSFIYD